MGADGSLAGDYRSQVGEIFSWKEAEQACARSRPSLGRGSRTGLCEKQTKSWTRNQNRFATAFADLACPEMGDSRDYLRDIHQCTKGRGDRERLMNPSARLTLGAFASEARVAHVATDELLARRGDASSFA